ncbi:MAG: hypothetical protein J6386_17735 [Candidatus Synoicihabitans palmerolidicus]|nr:hypothetical protein [Candidatus Synoicihabitans palmerolidicus]
MHVVGAPSEFAVDGEVAFEIVTRGIGKFQKAFGSDGGGPAAREITGAPFGVAAQGMSSGDGAPGDGGVGAEVYRIVDGEGAGLEVEAAGIAGVGAVIKSVTGIEVERSVAPNVEVPTLRGAATLKSAVPVWTSKRPATSTGR